MTTSTSIPENTAIIDQFMTAAINGDFDKVRELVESGAVDVNARYFGRSPFTGIPRDGRTALMYATYDYPEIARWLIAHGADVKIVSDNGFKESAVLGAASSGDFDLVRDLLKAGADTSQKTAEGVDALLAGLASLDGEALEALESRCLQIS